MKERGVHWYEELATIMASAFPVWVAALTLSGCGMRELSALQPQGPVAAMQFDLMKLSASIMIGVFIVVMLILTYVLIRYRKRPGQEGIPKQVEGSHTLEIIWTSFRSCCSS